MIKEPYNLGLLNSVFAKVIAYNIYGDSEESLSGNGAKVYLVPDPPNNLAKNPDFVSSKDRISIVWVDGDQNGGRAVIDYRVSIAQ